MAIQNLDYWYDGSMRRYLAQLVRAFSGWQYQPGVRNGIQSSPIVVPCRMANTNKQVGYIMRNLSENTLLTVPLITIHQTGLSTRRDGVQYPGHVDKVQVVERKVVDGKYTGEKGNSYTVERIMPRPFEITVQVDIWTSNLDQKHQLAEQIMPVIYPFFDVQNSQNPLDWTALTTVYVEDINWSSRSIPIGSDNEIDIMTITLKVPIWMSAPVKVTHRKVIEQIVTNIFDTTTDDLITSTAKLDTQIVTPGNYQVAVLGQSITLKGPKGATVDQQGQPLKWMDVLSIYGALRPTISQIRLYTTDDPEGDFVFGTVQLDPDDPGKLIWQIEPDSLPGNTMQPVSAIIEPTRVVPGREIPLPVEGVRYLLIGDIGPCVAWPNLTAKANDVITYTNGAWRVSFASRDEEAVQFVLNLRTGSQLRWSGGEWVMSIDATYAPGYWRLML